MLLKLFDKVPLKATMTLAIAASLSFPIKNDWSLNLLFSNNNVALFTINFAMMFTIVYTITQMTIYVMIHLLEDGFDTIWFFIGLLALGYGVTVLHYTDLFANFIPKPNANIFWQIGFLLFAIEEVFQYGSKTTD